MEYHYYMLDAEADKERGFIEFVMMNSDLGKNIPMKQWKKNFHLHQKEFMLRLAELVMNNDLEHWRIGPFPTIYDKNGQECLCNACFTIYGGGVNNENCLELFVSNGTLTLHPYSYEQRTTS